MDKRNDDDEDSSADKLDELVCTVRAKQAQKSQEQAQKKKAKADLQKKNEEIFLKKSGVVENEWYI